MGHQIFLEDETDSDFDESSNSFFTDSEMSVSPKKTSPNRRNMMIEIGRISEETESEYESSKGGSFKEPSEKT